MKKKTDARLSRWRRDPVAFISEVLIDPETSEPYALYPEQERFLREALTPDAKGRLPYSELLFSAPKKSGKTATAAMGLLYVMVCLSGPFGEGYCVANDYEQAASRVFQAAARIIQASPLLKPTAKITADRITFISTGATIIALASDYAGAAGSNPTITVFDELWGYTSERSNRLWDELVPVPTRKVSVRLTSTYAGFEGESTLLESLFKRGTGGEQIEPDLYRGNGMLAYWTNRCPAPWQSDAWREQMRSQLRPNAYLRLIENKWVSSESTFVPIEWWDACIDPGNRPLMVDTRLPVWIGLDASVKRDSTAIVAVGWDAPSKRVRLVWHRIFQPSPSDPLDFESTVEKTLLELRGRFQVREVRFDPWQLQAVAQRLSAAGLPMKEFAQSVPNLTESSTNLYELLKSRALIAYQDSDIRLAVSRAVAIETSRGWKISKEKASHKIDVIVALAMAALGCVQAQGADSSFNNVMEFYRRAAAGELKPKVDPERERRYQQQGSWLFDRTPGEASPFRGLRCGICTLPIGGNQTYCTLVGDRRGSYAHSQCFGRELNGG
ncbi:MAG: terminase TerL endonuclease subunit [Candidatus Binataceae bacterium]